jgi:hypothetical protein
MNNVLEKLRAAVAALEGRPFRNLV